MLKIETGDLHNKVVYRSDFCTQFKQLAFRNRLLARREPAAVIGRFGITAFFSILMLFIFWQTAGNPISFTSGPIPKPQVDTVMAQNTIGAMFMMSMMLFMSTLFANVLVFQLERAVFLREYCNQMYDLAPYYLTKMLIEIPVLLFVPLLMQVMTYWAIGFRPEARSFFMMYFGLEMMI